MTTKNVVIKYTNWESLNLCSCDEIKMNEARDHLFFTIMSRSGAIIFELTHIINVINIQGETVHLSRYHTFIINTMEYCDSTFECPSRRNAFDKTVNTYILNGIEDTSVNTLEECYASCLADAEHECSGFDYGTRENQCYKFDSYTNAGTRYEMGDIDHYNRKRCVRVTTTGNPNRPTKSYEELTVSPDRNE